MSRNLALVLIAWLLHGCAGNVPVEIRQPIAGSPSLLSVYTNPGAHIGQTVRWGGVIANVENRENQTWLEIVARRLDAYGEPVATDRTEGRFRARVEGFLDPQVFAKERVVTVYGKVEGTENGKVGEQPYSFPVVRAEKTYLWPQRADWRDDPWCRDYAWRYSLFYRYHYPGFYHRYWWGYPYGFYSPFWGPYWGPAYCR